MENTNGFYTALGTPLDHDGRFLHQSFIRQIKDQVAFGASGLLVMGSMGLGVFIRNSEYIQVVQTAIGAIRSACPVFIGVSDTSISRACDRIDALAGLKIDGVVSTPPYYYSSTEREQIHYFRELARRSPFPVYLYDLPVAARSKITLATIQGLAAEKNIKGIKTADLALAEQLNNRAEIEDLQMDFNVLYSGLDTFDLANQKGIGKNLDGMFACTGLLAQAIYRALAAGDFVTNTSKLRQIINLRDIFASEEILPSFTCAMNLLGYDGIFHPDYYFMPSQNQCAKIKQFMQDNQLF
jgi:4-hydroxy-tetrahydrodipicolinate synthase